MPPLTARRKFIRSLYWAGVAAVLVGVTLRLTAGWPNLGIGLALVGILALAVARVVSRFRL